MRQLPWIDEHYLLRKEELPRRKDGRVDWSEIYGRGNSSAKSALRLEVGVGNSPFLMEVARLEPDFNYLGLEYLLKRTLKFLNKLNASGLENVRMMAANAHEVVGRVLSPGDLDHVFVNFPDPWPKKRHAKHRFVQPKNIARVTELLRPGGGISLKTDSPVYAEQMLEVLEASSLENLSGEGAFAERGKYPFPTPFELRWRAEGRSVYYLEYAKVKP